MTNYEQFKSDSSILPRSKSKAALATMALTGALLLTPALSDTYTASADSIDTEEISTQSSDMLNTDITDSDDATAQSHYNQTNAESVNEYRAKNGKSQLTQQSDLDEFAKWKIDAFAGEFPTLGDINEFNNAGGNVHEFNGKSVDQQYEDYHGKPAESWLGENLAYSTGYVPEGTVGALDEQTMKQWKNSAPHDANMLNDNYGSIGTAYWSNGDGTYYTVQVFESGERVVQEVEPPTPGGDTGVDNEESQIEDIDDNTDNIGTLDPDEDVVVPDENDEGSYEIPEEPAEPEPNDPKHPEAPDWVDGNQDVYDDEDDVETPAEPEPTPEPELEPEPEAEVEAPEEPAVEDEEETTPEPESNTPDPDDTPEPTEDNEESETPDADGESDNTDAPEDNEINESEDIDAGDEESETPDADNESDNTDTPEVDESEDIDAGDDNSEPSDSDNAETEDADETSDNEDAPAPADVDDDNAQNDSDNAEAGVTPAPENNDIENSSTSDEAELETGDSADAVADESSKEELVLTPEVVTEEDNALTTDGQPSERTVPEVAKAVVTGVAVTQDENAGASSAFAKDAEVLVSEDAPKVSDAVIDPADVEVVEPVAESGPQTLPDTGIADAGKTTLLGSIAALMGIGAFAMSRRKRSEEK